ncbi:MAG: heme exporter protein CcmD [Porticoccaceae bacterium]
MSPQFHSVAELLAMGGHGPYVWSAYGVALAVLVGLVVQPLRRRAAIIKAVRQAVAREQNR